MCWAISHRLIILRQSGTVSYTHLATVEAVYSEAKEEETGEYVTYGGNYCEAVS